MINLKKEKEYKEVTYSLQSTFFGLFVIVQGFFYIGMLYLDSIIFSVTFIYISEIGFFIISLLISYLVWLSATYYSEKNKASFWGIVAKFIIGLSIFFSSVSLLSGYSIKERKQIIEQKILIEKSTEQLGQIIKMFNR
jgi:hypothetical protein